jgi:hypothetical protein
MLVLSVTCVDPLVREDGTVIFAGKVGTYLKQAVRISEWVPKGSYVQVNGVYNLRGIVGYGFICINAFWGFCDKNNWGTLVCEIPYELIYTVSVRMLPHPMPHASPRGFSFLSKIDQFGRYRKMCHYESETCKGGTMVGQSCVSTKKGLQHSAINP